MLRSSSTPLLLFLIAGALIPSAFANPWSHFRKLAGCSSGEDRPALGRLKRYLHHFGYLPAALADFTDSFDDDLASALRTYQRNFGLDVTGELDEATVKQLVGPRCGVADVINGISAMHSSSAASIGRRGLFSYLPDNPTWPRCKTHLTYAITETSAVSIDPSVLRAVFARAFARWSAVTPLTFSEAAPGEHSDITIGFYKGAHGDGDDFDGELGKLAHAFPPRDGRFHLDAEEQWVAEGDVTKAASYVAVDLESVSVHEIGHLLGLGHSALEDAVMYPTLMGRTRKVELSCDDVEGIQKLYGTNSNSNATAQAVSTMKCNPERSSANWAAKSGLSRRKIALVLAVLAVLATVSLILLWLIN